MLNNFILTVAFKYFRAKKNERFVSLISGFSLFGVIIGVAALIVVMSVMKGFHREFSKNIIGLNGDINITSTDNSISDYEDLIKDLQKKSYISNVTLSAMGQALAIGTKVNSGVLIRGINLEDLEHKEEVIGGVVDGELGDFSEKDIVAIGAELSHILGIKVGSKLKLISPTPISTAFGSMPRSKDFRVVAIFASGMYDYDAATVLMPLAAAQKFLSFEKNINLIEIQTINPEKAGDFAADIQQLLPYGVRAISWQKSNLQFLNALAVERVAMFTILSLIMVVAAFNIISSLFMLVKDKTKDIAILKTIGASSNQIMLIFICNGMFIGIIGTALGALVGTVFASNIDTIRRYLERITETKIFDAVIYFLYTLPSEVKAEDVFMVSVLSIGLCFLATIYPAYKAARLNPIDVLRYE